MRRIDEEIRRQARELYKDPQRKLSTHQVAEQLNISQTSVWKILVSNNDPRRSFSETKMKYPKTDFNGDPPEQARILGFMEDCGTRYYGKQIGIQTGTTHPAQIKWFYDVCGGYGHVAYTPGYNSQFALYHWQLTVYLNCSFAFVIVYKTNPLKFLAEIYGNDYEYIYIGSLTDAEGCIAIEGKNGYPQPILIISNNNRQLLEWTQEILGGRISRNGDGYNLRLRDEEAVEALLKLPLWHAEKVAAKELILRHYDNGGIGLEALREYRELRRKIDKEVQLCTMQARLEWIIRHGYPHRYDPDQTIPPF